MERRGRTALPHLLRNIAPGVSVWFPNTDWSKKLLFFFSLRFPRLDVVPRHFLRVRAALRVEESGQAALINMHVIPETRVKFSIKIPLHSAVAEPPVFTPSRGAYCSTWKCLNENDCQLIPPPLPESSGLMLCLIKKKRHFNKPPFLTWDHFVIPFSLLHRSADGIDVTFLWPADLKFH